MSHLWDKKLKLNPCAAADSMGLGRCTQRSVAGDEYKMSIPYRSFKIKLFLYKRIAVYFIYGCLIVNITGILVKVVMAAIAARGLGIIARKFAPNLMARGARAYASNPGGFRAGTLLTSALAASAASRQKKLNKKRFKNKKKPAKGMLSTMANGKFKKYKKIKKSKKKKMKELDYAKKGVVQTNEVHGKVEDPDCVYVGYGAQATAPTIYNIVCAIIRKLFNTCVGYDAVGINLEIPGYLFDNTGSTYKIVLLSRNALTEEVTVTHTWYSSDNVNLINVANEFNGFFKSYSANSGTYANLSSSNRLEPYKFQMYIKDGNVTDFWNFQGEMNFQQCMIDTKTITTAKIQNRSSGANGGTTADDVTNNPIIGRRYLTNGIPKARDSGFPNEVTNEAIKLMRAAQSDVTYKEPPRKYHFTNTVATAGVQLQPGEIKYSTVVFKKTMLLLPLLRWLNANEDAEGRVTNNNGLFEMFAFEDMINVNEEQNISIVYEVNRTVMSLVTYEKKNVITTYFRQFSYNNVA